MIGEKRFNIRVYGVLINDQNQLLVSDEIIKGIQFTKFPGGGLEWGEGTRECLEREFMEELSQPITVVDHYYTTDYFQQSAFRKEDQLMSIYYRVKLNGHQLFTTKTKPFDFPDKSLVQDEVHRWINLDELNEADFKWPVDKLVVSRIRSEFSKL
ncbi:NUDIX domain-containing protein [Salibacteraceae bacterium]|nr:NUDIX domain-containing protein [Salibacteraceae bacterium]